MKTDLELKEAIDTWPLQSLQTYSSNLLHYFTTQGKVSMTDKCDIEKLSKSNDVDSILLSISIMENKFK